MNCEYCGRQLKKNVDTCPHCGAPAKDVTEPEVVATQTETEVALDPKILFNHLDSNKSRRLLGFVFGVFFNWVGLVVGLLIFAPKSVSRRTFLQGWLFGLIGQIFFALVMVPGSVLFSFGF